MSITSVPPGRSRRRRIGASGVVVAALVVVLVLLHTGGLDPLLQAALSRIGGTGHAQGPNDGQSTDDAERVAAWYPYGTEDGTPLTGGNPGARNGAGGGAGDDAGVPRTNRGPAAIAPKAPTAPKGAVGAQNPVGTPERTSRWRWPAFNVPRKVAPKLEPMSSCPQRNGASVTIPVIATPQGNGTVSITWWDLGDPHRRSYQIGGVLVSRPHPPEIVWTKATAPQQCGQVTVTIRGLVRGGDYQFWLESLTQSPLDGNRTRQMMRGRSDIITVR